MLECIMNKNGLYALFLLQNKRMKRRISMQASSIPIATTGASELEADPVLAVQDADEALEPDSEVPAGPKAIECRLSHCVGALASAIDEWETSHHIFNNNGTLYLQLVVVYLPLDGLFVDLPLHHSQGNQDVDSFVDLVLGSSADQEAWLNVGSLSSGWRRSGGQFGFFCFEFVAALFNNVPLPEILLIIWFQSLNYAVKSLQATTYHSQLWVTDACMGILSVKIFMADRCTGTGSEYVLSTCQDHNCFKSCKIRY